jgi:hypothetical protein
VAPGILATDARDSRHTQALQRKKPRSLRRHSGVEVDLQLRQARLSSGALGWQRGSTESASMSASIVRQLSAGELGWAMSEGDPG